MKDDGVCKVKVLLFYLVFVYACLSCGLPMAMNTYQYNRNGVIGFLRARNRDDAIRKIFFGELKRNGSCDLTKIDLKIVRDPHKGFVKGNNVFSSSSLS